MKKNVKFYMVPSSPWCYLSMYRLRKLSKKYNFHISLFPIDIFRIFKKKKINFSLQNSESIQKNRINDLKRWREHLGMKLNIRPNYWPVDYIKANKLIISSSLIEEKELSYELAYRLCKAVWEENKNINDIRVIFKIAKEVGISKKVEQVFYSKQIQILLNKNTKLAEKDNVFGVPTFIYKKKLYWGQDRLFFLEKEVKEKLPR